MHAGDIVWLKLKYYVVLDEFSQSWSFFRIEGPRSRGVRQIDMMICAKSCCPTLLSSAQCKKNAWVPQRARETHAT